MKSELESSSKNVLDLEAFKKRKEIENQIAQNGRQALFNTHFQGKSRSPEFSERLQRIRSSLERINNLMFELKRMASSHEQRQKSAKDSDRPKPK